LELSFTQNVHIMASDHKKGTQLVKSGVKLLSPQIGVAASEGKNLITVSKTPSDAIISTGDELREIEAKRLKPYQIRMSNSYAIHSYLKRMNFEKADIFHLKDDKEHLSIELKKILETYDVLILSGGVSMGKFDYIPSVLNELGVEKIFH